MQKRRAGGCEDLAFTCSICRNVANTRFWQHLDILLAASRNLYASFGRMTLDYTAFGPLGTFDSAATSVRNLTHTNEVYKA